MAEGETLSSGKGGEEEVSGKMRGCSVCKKETKFQYLRPAATKGYEWWICVECGKQRRVNVKRRNGHGHA